MQRTEATQFDVASREDELGELQRDRDAVSMCPAFPARCWLWTSGVAMAVGVQFCRSFLRICIKFYKNLQIPRHLLQHDREGVPRKVHKHQGQDGDIRQDSRYGCTHTIKEVIDVITKKKRKTKSFSIVKIIGKIPAGENSVLDPKTNSRIAVTTYSEPGRLGLQRKENFEENEKNSMRIQYPLCSMSAVADTTFSVCDVMQTTGRKNKRSKLNIRS